MVQSGVDLAIRGIDRVRASRSSGIRLTEQRDQRTEETHTQLDQQYAEFQTKRSQVIGSGLTDTLDQTFRAELAQIEPKLAEAVLVSTEAVASGNACVQFASGPVADETARMQQRFEQADHSVIMSDFGAIGPGRLESLDAVLGEDQALLYLCGELSARTGDAVGALRWLGEGLKHPSLGEHL